MSASKHTIPAQSKKRQRKLVERRRRRIAYRLGDRKWPEQARPMMRASNIHYEVADKDRGLGEGGIAAMHLLAQRVGLVKRIDDNLHLLKRHLPYHESDHVEGVLFIGKAQEKAFVFRTVKRKNPQTGQSYPWLVRGTAQPNHYYFYIVDDDFGPMFIKFCSYFPYAVKFCINGHEWVKRQLTKEAIGFVALDNGILSCDNPQRLQQLCLQLDEQKIDTVFRKWLARLPHPFCSEHRSAGYRYNLSNIQLELSLTHVFDRPMAGRQFFEEVVRENIDLGRPEMVQLLPSSSRCKSGLLTAAAKVESACP